MFATLLLSSVFAAGCELSATPVAPIRVELYTSEGCSSCPPADRWFSALKDDQILALAFHVDYWDDLGWPDRFADARFSDRQRKVAARFARNVVYTPSAVIDGAEWHWRTASIPAARAPSIPMTVVLETTPQGLSVSAKASTGKLYAAVTESELHTRVRSGENAGSTLRHDHVVRAFGQSATRQPIPLALPADTLPANAKVLVWLENSAGKTLAGISAPISCAKPAAAVGRAEESEG